MIRMSEEWYANRLARTKAKPVVASSREVAYQERRDSKAKEVKRKYGNQPIEINGISFDSKAESRYYAYLQSLLKSGAIKDLRLQVPFELAPSVVIGGRKRPALRYVADFTYERDGKVIVADVKGVSPDAYRIKRHLMKSVHGIDIEEIRS